MPTNIEFTGAAQYVSFGGTVLSIDGRTFDTDQTQGTADGSAGADTARVYIPTLTEGKGSLEFLVLNVTAGDPNVAAVAPGTTGTLIWGELGNTVGNVKHTATAFVSSRKISRPYDNVVTCQVEFTFQGAVADGVF